MVVLKQFVVCFAKDADPNGISVLGNLALHEAYDNSEITEVLINGGADVNGAKEDGSTALLLLPQRFEWTDKREQVLRMLLQYKADVNKTNKEGKTALHYFADLEERYNGVNCDKAIQMIPLLIAHGAKVEIKDNTGKTPFDYAQARNNEIAMAMLAIKHEQVPEQPVLQSRDNYSQRRLFYGIIGIFVLIPSVVYFATFLRCAYQNLSLPMDQLQ